jgi:hypothetical protein
VGLIVHGTPPRASGAGPLGAAEPRLDGAEVDLQVAGDLGVFELVVLAEQEGGAVLGLEVVDRLAQDLGEAAALGLGVGCGARPDRLAGGIEGCVGILRRRIASIARLVAIVRIHVESARRRRGRRPGSARKTRRKVSWARSSTPCGRSRRCSMRESSANTGRW